MSYPGGKGRLFQKLINLMPPHDAYIEAFLGRGAVMRKKRPALRNIGVDVDEAIIREWLTRSPEVCELHHGDAISFLKSFRFTGEELVYCDPPYLLATRRGRRPLYRYEFETAQHEALLEVVSGLGCSVMLSGRKSELYTAWLERWHRIDLENVTRAGKAPEAIWLNFPPPVVLHDYRFIGTTFRERQTIERKLNRLSARVKTLPPVQQNALRERVWSMPRQANRASQ